MPVNCVENFFNVNHVLLLVNIIFELLIVYQQA